jgi:hypothetical protein
MFKLAEKGSIGIPALGALVIMKPSTLAKKLSLLKEYLQNANQWLMQTPDRALEIAYQAALKIKAIEDEHFDGSQISDLDKNNLTPSVAQREFEQFLRIAKRRLAEFQASYSVLGTSRPDTLEKLKFIDQVLGKYTFKRQSSLVVQNRLNPANSASNKGYLNGVNNYSPKPQLLPAKPSSRTQIQPLHPRSRFGLPANSGFAAMLLVGGLTVTGVGYWAVLAQHRGTNNNERENSVEEVHPGSNSEENNSTDAMANPKSSATPEDQRVQEASTRKSTTQPTSNRSQEQNSEVEKPSSEVERN